MLLMLRKHLVWARSHPELVLILLALRISLNLNLNFNFNFNFNSLKNQFEFELVVFMELQDEEFGGFGGPHCMVRGGYGQITDALAARLDVRLGQPVTSITAENDLVKVTVKSGTGLSHLCFAERMTGREAQGGLSELVKLQGPLMHDMLWVVCDLLSAAVVDWWVGSDCCAASDSLMAGSL